MCWWRDGFQTFALDSKGRMQPLFSVLWNYAAANSVSEDPKDFEASGNYHWRRFVHTINGIDKAIFNLWIFFSNTWD